MYPFRTMPAFVLLFVVCFSAAAQQANSKTLLWRISGRGLQKPSYLYGTMHLNDKRLFLFGDSVYAGISQSDGLAIEVNPDEMAALIVNQLFDKLEGKRLRAILKGDELTKYSKALQKKFHKPADEVTASDIVREKNKWMTEYMQKGEMPTFVDAYLYSLALRQGKWVGGIEDLADQAGLMEDLVDKSDIDYLLMADSAGRSNEINRGMEKMVALYTSGDLDGIDAYMNGAQNAKFKDRVLIQRNIKMARRIDSLVNLRTMFVAIGAAHLPGDTGVIDLLRKRGFTVSPVFSSQKIDQKNYTFTEVARPWSEVTDPQGMYKTAMPGNPAGIKVFGLIEMKFLMDLISMTGYCTMAIPTAADFSSVDTLFNNTAMRMLQVDKLPASKKVFSHGTEGREYIQSLSTSNLRVQLYYFKKVMYVSLLSSLKENALYSADANKFFASLSINQNAALSSASNNFTDSIMGISFVSPAVIAYNKKLSSADDSGWKISAFTGVDAATGGYVFVYSKEVKAGSYVSSDSAVYGSFSAVMQKEYHLLKTEELWLDSVKVLKLSGRNQKQPSLYGTAVCLLKDGRNVVILSVTDSANFLSPGYTRIFESLKLVPHPRSTTKTYLSPDNRFSCNCPAPLFIRYPEAGGQLQYLSYDSAAATTYTIIPDTLGRYFWANSDSIYWKQRLTYNLGTDTLISQQRVDKLQLPALDMLTKEGRNNNRYKRMRLLLDGDKVYKLFVSADKEYLNKPETDNFFSSFHVEKVDNNPGFYLSPKTDLLLKDLISRDSARVNDAYSAFGETLFTERDRNQLQDALFAKYYNWYDSTAPATFINYAIAEKLAAIANPSTVEFAMNSYNAFTERKDTLKDITLALLSEMHTSKSYQALAKLLQQSPPRQFLSYRVTGPLYDSLALTAAIFPELQQLVKDTLFTTSIARLANYLVDSGAIKMEAVNKMEPEIIHSMSQLLPVLMHDQPSDGDMYAGIYLLGKLGSVGANNLLQKFLLTKSIWLRKMAAIELIKQHQPVPPAVINAIAADKATRSYFYKSLKDISRAELFPYQYATQKYMAESDLYDQLSDDDDYEVKSMVFISKQQGVYNKKSYTFYLYRVKYEGEDGGTYLAIAGGYGKGLEPVVDLSGVHTEKQLTDKNITSLFSAYLRGLESTNNDVVDEEQ